MVRDERGLGRRSLGEGGFTLVEMMIAAALTMVVVGAAVALATSVQNVYSYELEDAAAQQEARFALDWISQTIAAGASNPYDIGGAVPSADSCTDEEPGFEIDPDGDTLDDDIRVMSDVVLPNGLLAGDVCQEMGENVTIARDDLAGAGEPGAITRLDAALEGAATAMTDAVFTNLDFNYLNASRAATTNPDAIVYVQVSLTVRSKSRNPYTGENTEYTYNTEVRVRSR